MSNEKTGKVSFNGNAEQYLELLRTVNLKLWETVLDTISNHFDEVCGYDENDELYHSHTYSENGNVIVTSEE
jgi:hypothetical protein